MKAFKKDKKKIKKWAS